jgi:hypothetical protein
MPDGAKRSALPDIVFALGVIAVAGVVWWEASFLPPPLYDPLGPGTAPIWLCWALIGLGAILLARALLGLAIGHSAQALILGIGGADGDYRLRPGLAVFGFAATLAYVAAMTLGVGFLWATMAFMAALGVAMGERTPRHIAIAVVLAVLGALGVDFLFRRVFVVLLP